MSRVRRRSHWSARSCTRSVPGSQPMNAAFKAPTDEPTRPSGTMPASTSVCIMPTCTAPRDAPPERTKTSLWVFCSFMAPPCAEVTLGPSVVITPFIGFHLPEISIYATIDHTYQSRLPISLGNQPDGVGAATGDLQEGST